MTYNAVIDCTDDHQMPAAALARAEPAGRLVYIGIAGAPSPIDSRNLVLGDLTAVGILGASAGLAPAIEHYADGRVDPAGIVREQPAEVQRPQPRVNTPGIPEEIVMITPRRGDRREADQERRIVAGVAPDRRPERRHRVTFGHRQLDSQQRDRDGDHRIGKEGQPLRRARPVLHFAFVVGH